MEQYLLRNHETRKYLQEQAYRLQQGIVMTTTQQAGGLTHARGTRPRTHARSAFSCAADDGHHVCEGSGPPELSALPRNHLGPGGREAGPEPDQRRQELQDGKLPPSQRSGVGGDPAEEPFPTTQLLPSLYQLGGGGAPGACGAAIQAQLESMASELARVVEEQLQVRAAGRSAPGDLLVTS